MPLMSDSNDEGNGPKLLELKWGDSGTALGLKITFNGGGPMYYSDGRPPAGSVALLLEHDGQQTTAAVMQRHWGEPQQALGYTYRVLNAPELKPTVVRIEVSKG